MSTANFLRLVLLAGLLGAGGPALAESTADDVYDQATKDASAAVDAWGKEMFDVLTQRQQSHREVLDGLNTASARLVGQLRGIVCKDDRQASEIEAFISLKFMTFSTVASGIRSHETVKCRDHELVPDVSISDFTSTHVLDAQGAEFAAGVRRSGVSELAQTWAGWAADNMAWWTAHPGEKDDKAAQNLKELRDATQVAGKHLAEIACDGDDALPRYAEEAFAAKVNVSAETIRSSVFVVTCRSGKLALDIKLPSRP